MARPNESFAKSLHKNQDSSVSLGGNDEKKIVWHEFTVVEANKHTVVDLTQAKLKEEKENDC
jgi:hypothetical protein